MDMTSYVDQATITAELLQVHTMRPFNVGPAPTLKRNGKNIREAQKHSENESNQDIPTEEART